MSNFPTWPQVVHDHSLLTSEYMEEECQDVQTPEDHRNTVSPMNPTIVHGDVRESNSQGNLSGFAKGYVGWSVLHAVFRSVSGRTGGAFENDPHAKKHGIRAGCFTIAGLPFNVAGVIVGLIVGAAARAWDKVTEQPGSQLQPLHQRQQQDQLDEIQDHGHQPESNHQQPHSHENTLVNDEDALVAKLCGGQDIDTDNMHVQQELYRQIQQFNQFDRQQESRRHDTSEAGKKPEQSYQNITGNDATRNHDITNHLNQADKTTHNKPSLNVNCKIETGQTTFAKSNQYGHGGDAACSSIVEVVVRDMLKGEARLHDGAYLETAVDRGASTYKRSDAAQQHMAPVIENLFTECKFVHRQWPDTYNNLNNNDRWIKSIDYNTKKTPTTLHNKLLTDLQHYGSQKKVGYLLNCTDTMAIVSNGNGTFDVFDPHGKTKIYGHAQAFCKRFDCEQLAEFLLSNNPRCNQAELGDAAYDAEIQQMDIHLNWIQHGKGDQDDNDWLEGRRGLA